MNIVVFLLALYIGCLVVIIYFFRKRASPHRFTDNGKSIFLSIVIPVKNENELGLLLEDIENQNLARRYYEVIVVDDHSDLPVSGKAGVKIIKSTGEGKKSALTEGVNSAIGNVMVTLDGDCRVGPDFLSQIYRLFNKYDVVLSPGTVVYSPAKGFFEKMQAMETLAIMGLGISLHHLGITSLSNGANLAFTKEAWTTVGGYSKHDHIPSGDDELLVQAVAKKFPDKTIFRESPEGVVATHPNRSLTEFIYQRVRWAGKWKRYDDVRMKVVAIITFTFHLAICIGIVALFTTSGIFLLCLFIIKFLLELSLIGIVSKRLNQKVDILSVLFLQLFYSPYVVLFGVASNFLPYKWKGRRYTHG